MRAKIRKIGNSRGIIIPKKILDKINYASEFDISVKGNIITISPINKKIIRRKPRDGDESEGLYQIMKTNLDKKFNSGEYKWSDKNVLEMTL